MRSNKFKLNTNNMGGTTPLLSDDQFKNIFEKKGAAATAGLTTLPHTQAPPSPQVPDLAPPRPKPVLHDQQFDKLFGDKAAPLDEGVTGTKQEFTPKELGFQPKVGQDNALLRAQEQGFFEQTGKTIGNTIANIPADLVQAIGYTGELLDSDHDYSNGLVNTMDKWKNPFGEVYREHPNQVFDLADPAWWLNNIGGFAEGAAQFVVPGEAEAAGVGALTKAVSTGMKLSKGVTEAVMGAGQVLSSAHLAYLMAASSGRQVYQEAYDTNYHRLLRQGLDPYTASEQAKEISANAAASTVQTSTALNTVFGLAALSPLFRSNQNRVMQWLETKGARQEGETLDAWKDRLSNALSDTDLQQAMKTRPTLSLEGYPAQALQIGMQGISNEYAEKVGKEVGEGKSRQNIDAVSDFFDKVTDQEGALNFLIGAVGGPIHSMLIDRIPVHRVIQFDSDGKPLYKKDPNVDPDKQQYLTKRVSARTRDQLGNQQFFNNMKDAIGKDVDWYRQKNTELQQAVKSGNNLRAEELRHEMFMVNNLNAVAMGLGDNWKKEYTDIAGLDNSTDLGQQMQPQIDALGQQIEQTKAVGQDTSPLDQQLTQLQTQQQSLAGKTDAMTKGFSRAVGDDEYKGRAQRAIQDLEWMKTTYDNTRNKYISVTDPNSEQLAYHIFGREAELHMMDHILQDERTSIGRDEGILNPLQTYQQQMHVAGAVEKLLRTDTQEMNRALGDNDFEALRRLAGKYGVSAYGDHMIRKGVEETVDKIRTEMDRHHQDVEAAYNTLSQNSGFDGWKEKYPGKNFQDYLNHLSDVHPIDDRIAERKANLEEMQSRRNIKKEQLDYVKSHKGREEFRRNAKADMDKARKEMEWTNQKDTTDAFLKQQDMAAAARILKATHQSEHDKTQDRILKAISRENELKGKIQGLRDKIAAGGMKPEETLSNKRKVRQYEEELARTQKTRSADNERAQQQSDVIQHWAQEEMRANSLTRDEVQNSTPAQPAPVNDTNTSKPSPEATNPTTPVATTTTERAQEDKPVQDYIGLKDQLSSLGRVQQAVDNLELMQDPTQYSFDMTRAALEPFVDDGTISEDLAHEIAVKQKMYLEHQSAESINATTPRSDLAPTPLPQELRPLVEVITPEDITGPEEPFSPVVNMSPNAVASPEEAQQIDAHIGAKVFDSMKINTAAIQYMEVVRQPKGAPSYHTFLPLYDKLDPSFNKNILKPGFIRDGDELHFVVDTDWKGKVNYDSSLEVDEFGDPMKRSDRYEDYLDEQGKVRMGGTGYTYENVPIKIMHARSGELVGYLPRTEWVTAQYAESGYRNMVDTYTDKDGNEITGNVEAQKQKILTVRRIITLAHNEGREEPVKSTVAPRDSGGHPFYSTDVNRNTERSKLAPKLARNLLPDPKLTFGLLNKGTVYTGHNSPLDRPSNFTADDLSKLGKPGQEANNIPMVILPMPNGKVSVSPLYTRALADRPADVHTIARAIEAHLVAGTPQDTAQHKKWREDITKASAVGGSKSFDVTNRKDLESFINQYYTYTQHFRAADTAFDAKLAPGTTRKPAFMLDIADGGIKVGTSWSGQSPIMASLTPDGKLDPRFEEALTDGLSTHYKNVVYTRGDIRGLNDDRPFHSITIKRDGGTRIDKHNNYNEYLKSFADTIVYGHHQADDGTYLYGANPVTNFDFDTIARTRIAGPRADDTVEADQQEIDTDDLLSSMINGAPVEGRPDMNTDANPEPPPPISFTLDHLLDAKKAKDVSLEGIAANIDKLYTTAAGNPEQQYTLDLPGDPKAKIKLGDGSTITMTRLAAMIDSRSIPYNIKLSDDFMSVLQNTPKRFLNNLVYEDHSLYEPLGYDQEKLGQQVREMYVPVRDENGKETGVFDSERQSEVVDSIIHGIKLLMDRGDMHGQTVESFKDKVRADIFEEARKRYDRVSQGLTVRGMEKVTPEQGTNLVREYDKLLRSFDTPGTNFWSLAMDKLGAIGIKVRDTRTANPDAASTDAGGNSTFTEDSGHGLRDWSDVTFETDPKDTATGRMKLFVATTPDSKVGDEEQPREVKLTFGDPKTREKIIRGQKPFSILSPAQVAGMGLKLGQDVTAKIDGKLFRVIPTKIIDEQDAIVHEGIAGEEGRTPAPGDMLLQLKPYEAAQHILSTNKNYLGLPKLANYEELFESVLGKLSDQPKDFNTYISILRSEGNQYHPNLRALADRLDKAPTEVKNEFLSVISLQYQPFTMVLLDSKRDSSGQPYTVLRPIEANRGSQLTTITTSWQQNQKYAPILRKNKSGITVIDRDVANGLSEELGRVNQAYEKGQKEAEAKATALARRLLDANGIILPVQGLDQLIANAQRWTKKTSVAGDFRRQFAFSDKGEPLGIFSSLISKLNGRESESDNLDDMEDKSFMLSNPLYTEKTSMNVLAKLTAAFTPQLYSSTHLSSEGKNIYDYGFNTALSRGIQQIKIDPAFRSRYTDVDIAHKSWLLDELNNKQELRERFSLGYLDGLKVSYMPGADGVTRPDMSDREQILTSIGLFINQGDPKYAHYLSLTHSDKSTTPVFRNAPRILGVTTSTVVQDKILGQPKTVTRLSEETLTRLHDVVHSEYDRITRAGQVGDYNNPKYEEGSKYFYFLPQMNYAEMKKAVGEGKLPQKVMDKIWLADGKLNVKEAPGWKEAVQYVVSRHVDDMTNNTLREWHRNGIIDDKNVPFDRKYLNRLTSAIGIRFDKEMTKALKRSVYMDRNDMEIDPATVRGLQAQLAARDYAVNHYLMNVSMSQLFYGDPAQVWKGSVDKTMVEYGKRLAKDIAPGRELAFPRGQTYLTITAKDFKTNAPYLAEVEGLKKAYATGRPLESTDAQEMTTVQEHIDVLRAAGRIPDKIYNEMSDIIKKAKGGYYEFSDPGHRRIILQPQKPVYVGDRSPLQGALLNDYIKSSSYPLYPPFLAGKELDKVRTAMEKKGIARLNFESAHKIGVPTSPGELFDVHGKFIEGSLDDTGSHQVLNRDGLRIQQEVPYDEDKDHIRTVSQMNKLITQGIALIKTPFSFDGREVSGTELRGIKEQIRKELFDHNLKELLPGIGAELRNDKLVITDRNKLFDHLQQRAMEGSLGMTANDLAYLGEANRLKNTDELVIPLMFAPSADKFERLLMSTVGDIGSVKMPGKSYIQASPAGQSMVRDWEGLPEEQKKNIVWVGGYDGSALKTVRPAEKGGPLQPAQVILPFRFGRIEDFTVERDGKRYIDETRIPKELLQLVGARIPNQGHNSMLPIEIAGFVPENMGDLVIVPAAITKQMGADFDVDKLYTYMRAYQDRAPAEGETGRRLELSTNDKDVLTNRYFDTHWSVLTHPEMLGHILNPLDKEDLKQEAALISKWEEKQSNFKPTYFDPAYQLRDFQSQKDAKRLVGLSSLSVTFNSVIQDKHLRPGILVADDDGIREQVIPMKIRDENNRVRILSTLSGYGQSNYDGNMRSKHDNHTTVQSEVVDYAKNKISDKVHLSTYTYPASAALTQLQEPDRLPSTDGGKLLGEGRGWAAHLGYNARLLSQPIIQEYVSEVARRGDSLSGDFTPDLKKVIAQTLITDYNARAENEPSLEDDHVLSYNELTDSLRAPSTVKSFNQVQARAMELFLNLDQIGSQMLRAQSTINHDTNGAGATFLDTLSQERTQDNLAPRGDDDLRLIGTGDLYHDKGTETEQGYLKNRIQDAAHEVVGKLFPYEDLMPTFDYLMEQTNRQDMSVDAQKKVFNAMKSYMFSHPKLGFWANPEVTRANLLYRREGNPSLADRVQEAKQTWGQNNYLLSRMQADIDPDGVRPSYVTYQASKASRMDDFENTKAWVDLFLSPAAEHRKLAEDLVRYSYLTGGLQDANSFIRYIPYSYLVGTDFGHKLRELSKDITTLTGDSSNFKEQWFQHNPQFAKSLSPEMKELGSEVESYPERFSLPPINRENPHQSNPASGLIVKVRQEIGPMVPAYPDFLSYRSRGEKRWILYKNIGRQDYVRIDTLGDKNMDEYSAGVGMRRSLIPENRSRAYDNIEKIPRMLNGAPYVRTLDKMLHGMDIPEKGGHEEMRQILQHIAGMEQIPQHTRAVSDFLSTLGAAAASEGALDYIMTRKGGEAFPAFRFEISNTHDGVMGYFNTFSNKIAIDINRTPDTPTIAEVINHEYLHYHTGLLTSLSESEDWMRKQGRTGAEISWMKHTWSELSDKMPEVARAVKRIDEVRMQAENKLREYASAKGMNYEVEKRKVAAGQPLTTDLHRLIYSMGSNTEFITGAMTHPATMRWLNQHPFDGDRTIMQQVVEVIKKLMLAIGSAFRPKEGSLLEAAMQRSLELVMVGQHSGEINPSQMSDVNNMQIISAAPVTSVTMVGLDRIIGKLQEQREQLVNSLTGRLSKEDIADKRSKIDEIEADIERMKESLSTDLLTEVGNKHLDWIQKVIDNESPTNSQVMTASRVLEVWTNLVDLLYGENGTGSTEPNIEQTVSDIYARAQVQRANLTMKMKNTLINTSDNIIGVRDFNSTNLVDIPRAQGLVRGLSSAATSKVTQYIATYMETIARRRDEDTTRLVEKMQGLEKHMAGLAGGKHNLPGYYNQFFQDNATHDTWGLVQRYSQDWYDFRKAARFSRDKALAATTEGKEKQAIWQSYWKKMNDNSIFADTRLLFDADTGKLKDDDIARKHREVIEGEIGKEATDELLEEAHERYGKYLEHKQARFDSLDGEVAAGERPADEAERLKDEFVARYSPNTFFNNFKGKLGMKGSPGSDYYVKSAPRRIIRDESSGKMKASETTFYDKKFEDIQKNPETRKVYEQINDTMQSLKESLPVHVQSQMGRNFMPVIAKSLFSDMIDVPGYIKGMPQKMIRDLTASATEELEGSKNYNQLPIRYTVDDRKNLPLESRSRDIPRMLEAFGQMALHYKHFADAKDYIDMGETVLREINRARGEGSSQMEQNGSLVTVKSGLRNTLDALEYMRDFLMYKKTRALEGKTETMLYSANPVKNFKITHSVKELTRKKADLEQQVINGDIDPGEAHEQISKINEELKAYGGRRLYGSKVGDKLITVNQLKTLSYNPFSGIANMAFGVVSAGIHANGRTDFSWKELGQAYKMMGHSILKWGSFGKKDTAQAGKILAIMDRLGIIGDVIDSHYGKVKTRERTPGWQRAVNPYNWMRSGDYYMKGLTTVAMLLHDKVDVMEQGQAKKVSLWEAFDDDGRWNEKRFGENKAWQSEDVAEQKELDKFRNKATRVNMIIHGNQDKNAPKLANKYILGRLLGQFRMSWLPEGWYSRFEGEREDIQLGRTIKGRYATVKDLGILGYATVTLKQLASIVSKVDPYTGISRLDGKPLSEVDINNMRRNFAELGFIASMAGTIITLKSVIDPDGDDKLKWSLRMLTNQLIRNQQDLEFYASPSVFDAITRNVIPASQVLKDYWKAMKATARVLTDDDYEASKWILAITRAGLPIPQATLVNKFKTAATRDLDTLQQ